MLWRGRRESDNVDDARGGGGGFGFPGGGGFRIPGGRGGGIGGGLGLLVILGLMLFFGVDPRVVLDQMGEGGGRGGQITFPDVNPRFDPEAGPREQPREQGPPAQRPQSTADDELKKFTSVVLADTEDVWREIFRRGGETYQDPRLVLFTRRVDSACGLAQSAMGPFYCPVDQKVYVDLSFYKELKDRFKAPGDFAQAYVIAHEVGHHVQTLLGITEKVVRAKDRAGEDEANAIQVRMELQADCLAGLWANHAQETKQVLEPGDIDEALGAASAIGDDRMQKRQQGYVVPDSFTHGSSEQRVRWFKRGFESGRFKDCDTFSADRL